MIQILPPRAFLCITDLNVCDLQRRSVSCGMVTFPHGGMSPSRSCASRTCTLASWLAGCILLKHVAKSSDAKYWIFKAQFRPVVQQEVLGMEVKFRYLESLKSQHLERLTCKTNFLHSR